MGRKPERKKTKRAHSVIYNTEYADAFLAVGEWLAWIFFKASIFDLTAEEMSLVGRVIGAVFNNESLIQRDSIGPERVSAERKRSVKVKNLIIEGIKHGFAGLNPETEKELKAIGDFRITPEKVRRLEPGQAINLLGWLAKADNPCSQKAEQRLKNIVADEKRQYSHRALPKKALAGNGF